ncbi:MAG: GTP cyclohydrolase I FolE [Segetibacter sp.]
MNTIEQATKRMISAIDAQPNREGLQKTPERVKNFVDEFFSPPDFTATTFQSEGYDEMVVQTNITFYSMCEHHLLPFFGKATVAYIPGERIIGLSKLARMLDHFSRRLQNQERITNQVADCLLGAVAPKGVGVVLTARHLCMEMRGVCQPEAQTTTSALRGVFKTRAKTRAEFIGLIKQVSL